MPDIAGICYTLFRANVCMSRQTLSFTLFLEVSLPWAMKDASSSHNLSCATQRARNDTNLDFFFSYSCLSRENGGGRRRASTTALVYVAGQTQKKKLFVHDVDGPDVGRQRLGQQQLHAWPAPVLPGRRRRRRRRRRRLAAVEPIFAVTSDF